ncbi:MAG TPA: class I SAM-dependent methyltransferase [Prolixibacteraceae bacterium]|jgi:SAM-dependent methyltransferase
MDKSEYQQMYTLESSFWWYRVLHELVDWALRKNKPSGEISILDAGCGTGRMMEICQSYGRVSGIDFSPDAIYFAHERGLNNIALGDLNDYKFENDHYDVVVCLDVLYHSAIQNDLAVVEKFYHTLKDKGLLIINLPAFDYLKRPHDRVVHTKKRYRRIAFEKDLKQIGFTILHSSYRMPLLYFIILIAKLLRSKSKTDESESDLKKLPSWLNTLLLNYGRLENGCIKLGIVFPVGSSLFVVAKKR